MSMMNNIGANDAQSPQEEIESLERMVMAFRLQELKSLLTFASQPSHGRKSEMLARALSVVRNTKSPLVKGKVRQLFCQILDKDRSLLESNYASPSGMSTGAGNSMASPYGIYGSAVPVTIPPNANVVPSRNVPTSIAQTAARQNIVLNPDIKLTHLPFYDVLKEVLKPTALVPMTNGKFQDNHVTLSLTREHLAMLSSAAAALPRTELQLRFCLLDKRTDQKDDFPSQCMLRMNEKMVQLPNVIPTNKLGVEAKRPSRPVDVTSLISRMGNSNGNFDQRIQVSWHHDGVRIWTVSAYIVRHLTTGILYERIRNKGDRPEEESVKMIGEKLGGDSCDIAATSLRVSLLCPLGKIRMRQPCRLRSCKHLQCFDLDLFLQMNEKKPTWTCPVCDAPTVPFTDLQVDGYFKRLIAQTKDESEVELYEGGGFSAIAEEDTGNSDGAKPMHDMECSATSKPVIRMPSTSVTQPKPKPPPPQNQDDDCVIIDLISDDEEEKSARFSKSASSGLKMKFFRSGAKMPEDDRSRSSSPSLIILDTPSPPGKLTPDDPTPSNAREQVKRPRNMESSGSSQSSPKRLRFSREAAGSDQTTPTMDNIPVAAPGVNALPDMIRKFMADIPFASATYSGTPYQGSFMPVPPPRINPENGFAWKPPTPSSIGLSSVTSPGSSNTSSEWGAQQPHLQQEFEAFLKQCLPPTSQ